MKYRYVFTWDDGYLTGSSSEEVKDQVLTFDNCTVYDCALGQQVCGDSSKHDVEEQELYKVEEDEQDDPDDEATPGRTVHPSLLPNPDEDTPFDER